MARVKVLRSLTGQRFGRGNIKVHVIRLREGIKDVTVRSGSVVSQALDKAGVAPEGRTSRDLDLRVNSKKAKLFQVLEKDDTIYCAPKVKGA